MSYLGKAEMSAFMVRMLTSGRYPGAGGMDGCDRTDNDDDARARQVQGHSGRRAVHGQVPSITHCVPYTTTSPDLTGDHGQLRCL